MSHVLLTGASGLLGSSFRELLADETVTCLDRSGLQALLGSSPTATPTGSPTTPNIVINCAAHTDVEAAERDNAADYAANVLIPAQLGRYCREAGATLVHFSSTGCYGSWKDSPYTEADALWPTTRHHLSKAAGEAAVRASGCQHLIVRTGWLYGGRPGHAKNFVWKRLLEARNASAMTSDRSQRGCPTRASDVARLSWRLVHSQLRGTLNMTANGEASRFEYVREIVAATDLACVVSPGPAFKRIAPVSPNETSLNGVLDQQSCNAMPHWKVGLQGYVAELIASPEWQALDANAAS